MVTIKKGLKGRTGGNLGQESGQLFIGTAQTVVQLCDPLHFVKGTQIDIEGTIVASVFWENYWVPFEITFAIAMAEIIVPSFFFNKRLENLFPRHMEHVPTCSIALPLHNRNHLPEISDLAPTES